MEIFDYNIYLFYIFRKRSLSTPLLADGSRRYWEVMLKTRLLPMSSASACQAMMLSSAMVGGEGKGGWFIFIVKKTSQNRGSMLKCAVKLNFLICQDNQYVTIFSWTFHWLQYQSKHSNSWYFIACFCPFWTLSLPLVISFDRLFLQEASSWGQCDKWGRQLLY